jgi:Flp pilus assembly protein TadD
MSRTTREKKKSKRTAPSAASRQVTPTIAPPLPAVRPWIVLAIVLATVLAYLPALRAPFVMDDDSTIAMSASALRSIPAGSPVAGRPVVRATLAANYKLNALVGVDQRRDPGGANKAIGYRVANILFHLLTGALLFGVLRRAARERSIAEDWRVIADPLAATACALWLLHPIQTEAINYIVQRTEILASLFFLATLYGSLRAWDATTTRGRIGWYAAAIVACVFGIGSKEIVITAPLAIILYDRAFRLNSWKAVVSPGNGRGWFYLALAGSCVMAFALVAAGARGGTAGFGGAMTWYGYFYTQCWAIAHYVRLVLWPNALAIDYGETLVTGARGVPGAVLLSLFALATLAAWRRLPKFAWFAFLGTLFFLLLAPSSSVVPIWTEVAAERRIYLALAVVLVLAVVGAEWLRRRYLASLSPARARFVAGAVALVLASTTAVRSQTYSSSELLWRDAAAKTPDNPRAISNLGYALTLQRPPKLVEAEAVLRRAMALDTTCRFGCSQLASLIAAQGRYAEAVALLERTLRSNPADARAEGRLALVRMQMGAFDKAIEHLEHVATTQPTDHLFMILGVADLAVQRRQDALVAFQSAARLNPGNLDIQRLGSSLFNTGRNADALPYLKGLAIDLAQGMQ